MLSRRDFCRRSAVSAALLAWPGFAAGGDELLANTTVTLAGGYSNANRQQFFIGQLGANGEPKWIELGYRVHQILPLGKHQYLAIGRRPETWMVWVDFAHQAIIRVHNVEAGCHLYGHAVIDPHNRVLITAENDVIERQGLVVLRDMDSLDIIERYPSHGLGPHQLLLDSDRQRLWVANGGFLLEPGTGRAIRNRDSFQSSLVLLDYHSGRRLEAVQHPDQQQSMRHIAQLDQATVAIGLQHHGVGSPGPEAAYAVWSPGQTLQTYKNPHPRQNYVTSVISLARDRFAVSMEKDHAVVVVDRHHGEVQSERIETPQGLAVTDQGLLVSAQSGGLWRYSDLNQSGLKPPTRSLPPGFWFDNHFIAETVS